MLKIIKLLRPHWKAAAAVICLLLVQALCELKLPGLMSDIVDIGLVRGGVADADAMYMAQVAAARELYDYIVNGNIRNSVNLPDAVLDERQGVCRLCIIHMNVPRMLTRFLEIIGGLNINVEHMINKSRGEYAYTMIDLGDPITLEQIKAIVDMDEVLRVRIL